MSNSPKTEWDSAMQKFGIIPKEAEITEDKIIEMIEEKVDQSKVDRIEDKTNEELDDMEDDLDDEEEKIIQRIRMQRMMEMQARVAKEMYGDVIEISKADWKEQVTEIGNDVFIVVHIYEQGNILCNLINDAMTKLAYKFKNIKFARGKSLTCIPNYPSKNIPTFLIYKNGDLITQWVGKLDFGGNKFSAEFLEWKLGEFKVLDTKIKNNPIKKDLEVNSSGMLIGRRRQSDSEDENDW